MSARFVFPVETHTGGPYLPTPHTVATFFTWSDAYDFISAERDARNLYLGDPRYDKRVSGYRPAEPDSGYRQWLAEIDAAGEQFTLTQSDPMKARAA